ncbi:acetaldehyde dehydrogenase [Hathewaya proteolytica DSM 3090]|uniref:Acetaldehyde dehydrogenase n=1 Tax=Hathewaya proteolytica DSM 3090 TaxID=1121331 RepID=A0A1M6KC29_9CLOT|nr:acetaldehyde dehydrogenase (acetylating) [Hathewaya proteolytica]SHJ56501.1 acetaldehyde dehydrogenase [Hathewaya proteolytica DSM 3090]
MNTLDKDLMSIQDVRSCIARAKKAQEEYKNFSQEQVDRIVKAVAEAAEAQAIKLAKMANEETGFGIWEDKVIKNLFASKIVFESMKDMKTVGIIAEDQEKSTMDVAVPVGVVAGIIPSTNPTSTTIYKTLISLKSGNAIVVSPHPGAQGCILETVKILKKAAKEAGAPDGIIECISIATLQGTQELMKHKDTALILATGGEAMVKAAYSSGNPAIGVGPGNGPAYIDKSADVKMAVKRIFHSKTFDNGVICASEQSIVIEECMREKVMLEVQAQGGYFLNREESKKLGSFILRANGTMNPAIVGKSVETLAKLAGLDIPKGIRVLISEETTVSKDNPYSREKLTPILAFYVEKDMESACDRCVEILMNEGKGHTVVVHCEDKDVIRKFALKQPISRMLVNTPGALGGIGGTTNLVPALTLGCGAIGGSSTSANVGPMDLINIKKVAYGIRELEDIRKASPCTMESCSKPVTEAKISDELIEAILEKLMEKLAK